MKFVQPIIRFWERWHGALRVVAGAAALTLGFWGWMEREPPAGWEGVFNNAFRTLQLITLQFPREVQANIPWQLQIARFLMPMMAVFESFRLILSSVRNPLRHLVMPRVTGHIVVCGTTREARTAMRAFARKGDYVVGIGAGFTPGQINRLELEGVALLDGDLRDEKLLDRAGVSRARALFICDSEDVNNLNVAMIALRGVARRKADAPFDLTVLVNDEDLAEQMDAALDGLAREHGVRYHRCSTADIGAQQAFEATPPARWKVARDVPTHTVLVGFGSGAPAVVRHAIRLTQDCPGRKPVLTVIVDPDEAVAFEAFRRARPDLPLVVDIEVLVGGEGDHLPADEALAKRLKAAPPVVLAFVCRSDTRAIQAALALRRAVFLLVDRDFPIHVHQSRTDRFFEAIRRADVRQLDMTRLFPFGGRLPFGRVRRLVSGDIDRMARAIHDGYLAELARQGATSGGTPLPWEALSENLRDSNRAAAAHIPVKLGYVGGAAVPIPSGESQSRSEFFSTAEIEALAEMEHRRWCAERILSGWRYGTIRDDMRRLHPDLIDYSALSEAAREKDRAAVRSLTAVLGLAGQMPIRIIRDIEHFLEADPTIDAKVDEWRHKAGAAQPVLTVVVLAVETPGEAASATRFARAYGGAFEVEAEGCIVRLIQQAKVDERADLRWLIENAIAVRAVRPEDQVVAVSRMA